MENLPKRVASGYQLWEPSSLGVRSLRTLGQDKAADVVLELDHPVCFDPWSECSVLHRLVLRIGDVVAAVGMGKVLEESP
jgi:translation elongation factor EF-1alpha